MPGRAGFDTAGTVVVQAPEHVVENERALAKAGDDPKKRRKVVRKKPPEGFVSWGEPTFERLVAAEPEPLTSSFAVSHAMLLNVIARPGDAFAAMRHLLTDNHEDPPPQGAPHPPGHRHLPRAARRRASSSGSTARRRRPPVRLTVDLQPDFALNQPLSPFALAALDLLDRESPTYALDVVSVIEATLDDPRQVLSAQQYKARGEAVAAMKADGIEYDERMELLDAVTYPKPLAELLDAAFDIYRQGHPWVADYQLAPKSVVRDMYERAMTFVEYVGFYGLARSEGLVLRYLADAYKALRQTVPEDAKTEELIDLIEWLGELVRQVDSSLLDEWERLRNPAADAPRGPPSTTRPAAARRRSPPTPGPSGSWSATRCSAGSSWPRCAATTTWASSTARTAGTPTPGPTRSSRTSPSTTRSAPAPTPAARRLLIIDVQPARWTVRQIFDDPAGDHDWGISAEVDLAASDEAGAAVLRVTDVGQRFGAGLSEAAGIHLRTSVADIARPVIVADEHGDVGVYGVPYLLPDAVMADLGAQRSHASVLSAAAQRIRADAAGRGLRRTVVAAHAFITGGAVAESERDIRVGGISDAPASVFDGFSYVALGHLHGQQQVPAGRGTTARYSGSPLAFSFSEAAQAKSVTLAEIDAAGRVAITLLPVPVPRPLREVRGKIDDLLARADGDLADLAGAWVKAVLTDTVRPACSMERLREKWPHTLVLDFAPEGGLIGPDADLRRLAQTTDPVEICGFFVEFAGGGLPDEAQRGVLRDVVEAAQHAGAGA